MGEVLTPPVMEELFDLLEAEELIELWAGSGAMMMRDDGQ
jgi:hypothetical protein